MTKKQWFLWGKSDQIFSKSHPESILQEAWTILIKDIDEGIYSWQDVFNGFPHYKLGVLKATKELKI